MSRTRIIQMLLIAMLAGGCSKSEPEVPQIGGDGTSEVMFGSTVDWTKGAAVSSIDELSLYTIYSKKTWENSAKTDMLGLFNSDHATPIILSSEDGGQNLTYEGGTRYWPTGDSEYLNFIALYPAAEIASTTFDETTGKPSFNYISSPLENNNDDLVLDAQYDMTVGKTTNGKVEFSLEHLLTKLSLEVKLDGENPDDGISFDASKDVYVVDGISFSGLYDGATLNIDNDGTTSWTHDKTRETIEITASQNNTIVPILNDQGAINAAAKLNNSDFTSVMASDKSFFVLPQDLGVNRTTPPTATVRIRRLYWKNDDTTDPTGKMMYASAPIVIPAADETTGWEKGMHNVLQFIFDLTKLDEFDTPLTLKSVVHPWTEADVDIEIHPNTYVYTSDGNYNLASTDNSADMYLFTNYEYDVRLLRARFELDGTPTIARGLTFYPEGSTTSYVPKLVDPASANGTERLLDWSYDENGNILIDGTIVPSYGGEGGSGFLDMSQYFWTSTIPGSPVACHPYGNYTGAMSETADWLKFKVEISDSYSFYFYASLLVRGQLDLYTNSSVENSHQGVNKDENDAVYILRLEVENNHLTNGGDGYGYFKGKIGAEMLSNGGGLAKYKFNVDLKKELSN